MLTKNITFTKDILGTNRWRKAVTKTDPFLDSPFTGASNETEI